MKTLTTSNKTTIDLGIGTVTIITSSRGYNDLWDGNDAAIKMLFSLCESAGYVKANDGRWIDFVMSNLDKLTLIN